MRKAAIWTVFALLGTLAALAQTGSSSPSQGTATPTAQQTPATPSGSAAGEASSESGAQTQAPAATQPTVSQPTSTQPASPQPAMGAPSAPQPPAAAQPTTSAPEQNTAEQPQVSSPQVAPAPTGPSQVAANTEIHAALDTPLSSKTSKPGDRFTATVSDPVRGANGAVVIPTGSRIEGEVAESEEGKTLPALRGKGKLSLRFRDVLLPNGQTLPLTATLVSVNSTNGKGSKRADEEGQVESGTQGKDVAKDVGIGAGIGTVAGLIFGGPLKGLAVGALAGGGYVLATKGKDVELPAQTGLVIRLDQPVNSNGVAPQP